MYMYKNLQRNPGPQSHQKCRYTCMFTHDSWHNLPISIVQEFRSALL